MTDPEPPAPALKPAATLVLLRPSRAGFEVLLTRRPATMRFGPGMHVFPGGRLEPGEDAATAAVRETAEETGIEVEPATLVPLTRWVTPIGLPSRFDARFFAAIVAPATEVRRASAEVAECAWLRPTAALEAMAAGRLAMWQPTVVTLQQLEPIEDPARLAEAFEPHDPGSPPDEGGLGSPVPTSWLAGIEGRHGTTRLVGRHALVVLNPGDPTEGSFGVILREVERAGATLAGVVIEDLAPEHHAGVELFARGLDLPVAGPPGADAIAPYRVLELDDGARVPFGDLPLVAGRADGSTPLGDPVWWADRAGRIRLRAG